MLSEPNHHSRNLKLVSLLFILYWVLGLEPIDDSIRLIAINYEISNPYVLTWVSYIILLYFSWRFYLSSRMRVRSGYWKSVGVGHFNNRKSRLFRSLQREADKHYIEHHKDKFEKSRSDKAEKKPVEGFNNTDYVVNPVSFGYESKALKLNYQVLHEGRRLPGNDFINGSISYSWNDWLWFKLVGFMKFIIGKEEAPDYLVPWLLLLLAIMSSVLMELGIAFKDIG